MKEPEPWGVVSAGQASMHWPPYKYLAFLHWMQAAGPTSGCQAHSWQSALHAHVVPVSARLRALQTVQSSGSMLRQVRPKRPWPSGHEMSSGHDCTQSPW